MTAASLGWGRGWPACPTGDVVTALVGTNRIRVPVRREIVPLLAGLVLDLEAARREPFVQYGAWGFACRAIAGTKIPSDHSQAVAADLDAPNNPHMSVAQHATPHPGRRWFPAEGRFLRSTMPETAAAIAGRWGFYWGGRFAKPDPMHFQIAITPHQAARLIAELRELDGRPGPTPPKPLSPEEGPVLIQYLDSIYLLTDGRLLHIASPEQLQGLQDAARAAGRPMVEWNLSSEAGAPTAKDQWRRIVATFGRPWSTTPPDGYEYPDGYPTV